MDNFVSYFYQEWLSSDAKISQWNHFNTVGPRTTNNAEGYHSLLKHSFSGIHPALNTFLSWLQKRQFIVQSYIISLNAGTSAPRTRKEKYIQIDNQMDNLKAHFIERYDWITNYAIIEPFRTESFINCMYVYCHVVSYLFGNRIICFVLCIYILLIYVHAD